jgi:hypothetical protein
MEPTLEVIMKNRYLAFLCGLLILILGCDPGCEVLVEMHNLSNTSLRVYTRNYESSSIGPFGKMDTIELQSNQKIVLYSYDGIGNSDWVWNGGLADFFDTLEIYQNDSLMYTQNPCDIEKWTVIEKNLTKNGGGIAHIKLNITQDSLSFIKTKYRH